MNRIGMGIYFLCSIVLAAVSWGAGSKASSQKSRDGKSLGTAAFLAALLNVAYLLSTLMRDYFIMSVFSSIYQISSNLFFLFLYRFVLFVTGDGLPSQNQKREMVFFSVFAVADAAIMIINPFAEIAMRYIPRPTMLSFYSLQMKPLYWEHLALKYLLAVRTLHVVIQKVKRTPREYTHPYLYIIGTDLFILISGTVFLLSQSRDHFSLLDVSVMGYSIGVLMMYWNMFEHGQRDILRELSMTIYENIDQGMVVFDYHDQMIMHNKKADELFGFDRFGTQMGIDDFIEAIRIPHENRVMDDRYSVQIFSDERGRVPLRCDYRRLYNTDHAAIGNLFVFTEIANDFDIMTGFMQWENFTRMARRSAAMFALPTAAVVFDIVELSQINRTQGHDAGDREIRDLVDVLKQVFPEDSYFVRGFDAELIVVRARCTEEEAKAFAQQVVSQFRSEVEYGIYVMTMDDGNGEKSGQKQDVVQAVNQAARSLRAKTLINPRSAHSEAISSLVRALRETDTDTEAHVQRTQKMGQALGERLGLTDGELSSLSLLCLLHDIGKIGIPLEILNKPGKLSDEEWDVLRSHAEKGFQICRGSKELQEIAQMVYCHHERWDGRGYPNRLAGEDIPKLSRIISLVDAYDAMVNDRSYRKAMTPEEAQAEINRCAGTQFDPAMSEAFLELLRENPDVAAGEKVSKDHTPVLSAAETAETEENGDFHMVPFCSCLLSQDGSIVSVSDGFEQLVGYTREELQSMKQSDLIPPEDLSGYQALMNRQMSRGSNTCVEHSIQRKDGERLRVVAVGKRYFDSAVRAFRTEFVLLNAGGAIAQQAAETEKSA